MNIYINKFIHLAAIVSLVEDSLCTVRNYWSPQDEITIFKRNIYRLSDNDREKSARQQEGQAFVNQNVQNNMQEISAKHLIDKDNLIRLGGLQSGSFDLDQLGVLLQSHAGGVDGVSRNIDGAKNGNTVRRGETDTELIRGEEAIFNGDNNEYNEGKLNEGFGWRGRKDSFNSRSFDNNGKSQAVTPPVTPPVTPTVTPPLRPTDGDGRKPNDKNNENGSEKFTLIANEATLDLKGGKGGKYGGGGGGGGAKNVLVLTKGASIDLSCCKDKEPSTKRQCKKLVETEELLIKKNGPYVTCWSRKY